MLGARGRREAQVPRAHKGPEAPQPSATTKANKDQTPPRRGAVSRGLAQSAQKGSTKLSAELQSLK